MSGGSSISTYFEKVNLADKKWKIDVSVSDPQPETAFKIQTSQSAQVGNSCATGTGSIQVRRDESFAKLSRKAQLYETAKVRFKKCLVYHNQNFHESLSEADFLKMVEVRLTLEANQVSKQKWKNQGRLKRREAKALADQLRPHRWHLWQPQ